MTKLDINQKKQNAGGAIGAATLMLGITILTSLVSVATSIASAVIRSKQINKLPPAPAEIHYSRPTLSTQRIMH